MSRGVVFAVVKNQAGVARAMRRLRRMGISNRYIELLTEIPYPPTLIGGEVSDTRLPWFTAAGLIGGLLTGLFLAVGTLLLYPLIVGSQAILSPPVVVIVYEITILGLVVMTFVGFVYENRIRRDPLRDWVVPANVDGHVLVVQVPPDMVESRVREALLEEGARILPVEEPERTRPEDDALVIEREAQ